MLSYTLTRWQKDHVYYYGVRAYQMPCVKKLKKFCFVKQMVVVLGDIASYGDIKANSEKHDHVPDVRVLQSKTELWSFLMFCLFLWRFVKELTNVVASLHVPTSDDVPFCWTEKENESFKILKWSLTSPPVLGFPDTGKSFVLFVEARKVAVGSSLMQRRSDGSINFVQYASRSLIIEEEKYCTLSKRRSPSYSVLKRSEHNWY